MAASDKSEGLKKENECTTSFFTHLQLKGQKEILHWCMSVGLIAGRYECPKCGNEMRLCAVTRAPDGYFWRCRKKGNEVATHDVDRSVRKGSVFYSSHLSICDILRIIRFWFGRCVHEFVKNELGININVVGAWYRLCREVCMVDVMNKSVPIGGEGCIVEIFECELKMAHVKALNGQSMFGGIERKTNKCFFKAFKNPMSKEELLAVIEEWVLPGSVVVSDCLDTYNCMSDERFIRLSSNLSLIFKSPIKTANNSELIGSAVKQFVWKSANVSESEFDSYLGEYMWRSMHNHSMSNDVFKSFLEVIAHLYNPSERDDTSLKSKS